MKLNLMEQGLYDCRYRFSTREVREQVLAAIEKLIAAALTGTVEDSSAGICRNLALLGVKRVVDFTAYMAVHWKHPCRARNHIFPIGGDFNAPKWAGDPLTQRLHFLRYMRKRLRDQLRRQA